MASKLCLVCLQRVELPEFNSASKTTATRNEVTKFLNILRKFINAPMFNKVSTKDFYDELIYICSDCNTTVSLFCDLHQTWELLDFQLNWNLEKLLKVMCTAEKLLSRKKCPDNFQHSVSQNVQQIRAPIIKQGKNKLSAASPRVSVTPLNAQILQRLCNQPDIKWKNVSMEDDISPISIHVKTEQDPSCNDDSRSISPISEFHSAPALDADLISLNADKDCGATLKVEALYDHQTTDAKKPQETNLVPIKLSTGRKFTCGVCQITFDNYNKYRQHIHFSMVHQRRKCLVQKNGKRDAKRIPPAKATIRNSNANSQHVYKTNECILSEDDYTSDTSSSNSEETSKQETPAHRKKCTICLHEVSKGQMKQHFKVYHNVKPSSLPGEVIHCPVKDCHAYFLKRNQKRYHMRKIHQTLRVSCPETGCNLTFSSTKLLKLHQTRHGKFKCNFCAVEKTYAPHLATHEQTHVKTEANGNSFQCSRCNYSKATKIRSLVKHFCREHIQDPFRCTICSGSFKYHGTFEQHVAKCQKKVTEIGRSCKCDLCSANFATAANLCHHKITKHWNLQCPECQFKPGTKLKNCVVPQIRTHIQRKHPQLFPELPFHCSTCKLQLPSQQSLEEHSTKVHPKFYQCDKCPKKLTSRALLLRHRQNEHGERRFVCEICVKPFVDLKTLNRHRRYHKDPTEWKFSCDTCGKRFVCNNDLTRHFRIHTGEKPFVCRQCGDRFAVKSNMNLHVKRKHKVL